MEIQKTIPRLLCRFGPVLLSFALIAGCGGDGLDRIAIKGTVTYNEKPVDAGAIFFEPTASVGKLAPTVYLPIRKGKFDTGNEGPVKGLYKITIGGFDKSKDKKDNDVVTHTELLFPDYSYEVEITPTSKNMDIVVPQAKPTAKGR